MYSSETLHTCATHYDEQTKGPVHTSAFSNLCVFVRPKTHRLIRVHTTVFAAFSTVHTNTLENDV